MLLDDCGCLLTGVCSALGAAAHPEGRRRRSAVVSPLRSCSRSCVCGIDLPVSIRGGLTLGMRTDVFLDQPPEIQFHLGNRRQSASRMTCDDVLVPIRLLASWKYRRSVWKGDTRSLFMVLETGVVLGVFASLDLFPLHRLLGSGSRCRMYASSAFGDMDGAYVRRRYKVSHVQMAGSVLMLVAIVWLYRAGASTLDIGLLNRPRACSAGPEQRFAVWRSSSLRHKVRSSLHTRLPDLKRGGSTAGSVLLDGREAQGWEPTDGPFLSAALPRVGCPSRNRGSLTLAADWYRLWRRSWRC